MDTLYIHVYPYPRQALVKYATCITNRSVSRWKINWSHKTARKETSEWKDV